MITLFYYIYKHIMNEQCGWKKFEQKQKKKSMKKIIRNFNNGQQWGRFKREKKNTLQNTHKSNTMHDINDLSIFNKREKI